SASSSPISSSSPSSTSTASTTASASPPSSPSPSTSPWPGPPSLSKLSSPPCISSPPTINLRSCTPPSPGTTPPSSTSSSSPSARFSSSASSAPEAPPCCARWTTPPLTPTPPRTPAATPIQNLRPSTPAATPIPNPPNPSRPTPAATEPGAPFMTVLSSWVGIGEADRLPSTHHKPTPRYPEPMLLYAATTNPGKLRDFARAAEAHRIATGTTPQTANPIRIEPLPNIATLPSPPEDEPTFELNARAKAVYYSLRAPSLLVLADDSGLEVAALDNA